MTGKCKEERYMAAFELGFGTPSDQPGHTKHNTKQQNKGRIDPTLMPSCLIPPVHFHEEIAKVEYTMQWSAVLVQQFSTIKTAESRIFTHLN